MPNQNRYFNGFTPDTIRFLQELKENNNKTWFESQRQRFRTVLQEPFQNLVKDLINPMLALDPQFQVEPINKNISRINRDIRFSKDKSPYRPNMWLSFKRPTEDWKQDPVYFFEVMWDCYRYGMGFSKPSKGVMTALREIIDQTPQKMTPINALIDPHTAFKLMGDTYKRPVGTSALLTPELATWYIRKDMYIMVTRPIEPQLYNTNLVSKIIQDFSEILPIYHFFWDLKRIAGETETQE